jgi:hypothetical protein
MKLDYSKIVKNNFSRRNDILHYQISTQSNMIETNKGKNVTQIKKIHLSNYNKKTNVLQQIPNNMDENMSLSSKVGIKI